MKVRLWHKGFTIVELVIVVVVIGIVAAITVVSYSGILGQNREKALEGDLYKAATQLHDMKMRDGSFPATISDFSVSNGDTTLTYSRSGDGFCVSGANSKLPDVTMYVTDGKKVTKGGCPPAPAVAMQTVTTATCSTARTLAYDARDNHTYWIQKMPDNKCWMLTNLAYAGGGNNIYGDTKFIQNGTSDTEASYTSPKYYIPVGANPTVNPAMPSTSSDGGVTGRQYGYLYNWCAAMGNQASTGACSLTIITPYPPAPNPAITVCPSGWRLPTGGEPGTGHEFENLANALNANAETPEAATNLANAWLVQMAGQWASPEFFYNGSSVGQYLSSSEVSISPLFSPYSFVAAIGGGVMPSLPAMKGAAASVRCVAI